MIIEEKIVLVTGASSGIGRAVAKTMAQAGYTVYGTSRRADYKMCDLGGACCAMLPMTLEDEASINKTVDYIISKHGRIDILVNSAGSGYAGAIEETSSEEAFGQFDVCFFGLMRVISCVLPHMRAAGGGAVINIGSLSTRFPVPFQGLYSAAKSALFTLSVVLRMELKPFNIRVCTIEPGNTVTGFAQNRKYSEKTQNTAYKKQLEHSVSLINSGYAAYSCEKCAKAVLKAARRKNPPVRVSVGFGYKLLYGLSRLTGWKVVLKVIEYVYIESRLPKGTVWTIDEHYKEK